MLLPYSLEILAILKILRVRRLWQLPPFSSPSNHARHAWKAWSQSTGAMKNVLWSFWFIVSLFIDLVMSYFNSNTVISAVRVFINYHLKCRSRPMRTAWNIVKTMPKTYWNMQLNYKIELNRCVDYHSFLRTFSSCKAFQFLMHDFILNRRN